MYFLISCNNPLWWTLDGSRVLHLVMFYWSFRFFWPFFNLVFIWLERLKIRKNLQSRFWIFNESPGSPGCVYVRSGSFRGVFCLQTCEEFRSERFSPCLMRRCVWNNCCCSFIQHLVPAAPDIYPSAPDIYPSAPGWPSGFQLCGLPPPLPPPVLDRPGQN